MAAGSTAALADDDKTETAVATAAGGKPILSDGFPDMSQFPPVYLYKDQEGREYTIELVPGDETEHGRGKGLRKRVLDGNDRALLARIKAKLEYLPDLFPGGDSVKSTKQVCTGTAPPPAFTIMGSGGSNSVGSIGVCNITPPKPPGAHTQWLQFSVGTYRVASNQVHVPVAAWFKPPMHGHGMYFGDTSSSACINNGQPSTYNTRIEAWSCWQGYGPARSSPYFQSTGFTYNDTCGVAWQDSFYTINKALVDTNTRYRVTMHASDGQGVMYLVDRRTGTGPWISHTPAVWRNVTYGTSWPIDPNYPGPVYGSFDPTANGVAFVGTSIPPTDGNPGTTGSWFVQITNLATNWF